MTARRLDRADRDLALDAFCAGFADEPYTRWALDGPGYKRRLGEMMSIDVDESFVVGELWATPGFEAVAGWSPSAGRAERRRLIEADWSEYGRLFGERGAALRQLDLLAVESVPEGPLWYLESLATAPRHRRRGHASDVLAPVLERCDRDGLPAALDTANAAALPFYAAHGFTQVGTAEVADAGAPRLWVLLREPGGSGAGP